MYKNERKEKYTSNMILLKLSAKRNFKKNRIAHFGAKDVQINSTYRIAALLTMLFYLRYSINE